MDFDPEKFAARKAARSKAAGPVFDPARFAARKAAKSHAPQSETPGILDAALGTASAALYPATGGSSEVQAMTRGFLDQPSQGNALERTAETVGKYAPRAALGIIGQAAAPGIVLGGLAAGAGAATSIIGQRGAQAVAAGRVPGVQRPGFGDTMREAAWAAGTEAATSIGVPAAVAGAVKYGPKVLDYMATSKVGGGIAKPAWDFLKGNVDRVLSLVGKGAEADDIVANDLRTVISNSTQTLEDQYKAGVVALQQGKSGQFRLNMDDAVGDKLRYIANEDAGYTDPARNAASEQAGFFLKNIVMRVNNLKQASPLDIYNLQRDLNGYIRDNIGTSLGGHLLAAKDVIREFIENHPKLKPIAEMNAAWHDAKLIEMTAKDYTNKNDLIGYVQRVFGNPRDTLQKRGLERVGAMVPEVAEGVQDARALESAKAVTPLVRSMTGTGFETGLGVGGMGALLGAKAALLAPALPLISPRGYAYAAKYAPQISQGLADMVPAAQRAGASLVPTGLSIADLYRRSQPSPAR